MKTIMEQGKLDLWQRHLQPLYLYPFQQNSNGKQPPLKMSLHSKSTNHMSIKVLQRELEEPTNGRM